MGNKKISNTGIRNGKLFCFNCGGHYNLPNQVPVQFIVQKTKLFERLHKDCTQTWTQPFPEKDMNIVQRAVWWMNDNNGEHGQSSLAIFLHVGKKNRILKERFPMFFLEQNNAHPYDADDLKRCYFLLKILPEWEIEFKRTMQTVSIEWKNLVNNWDLLIEMLEKKLKGEHTDLHRKIQSLI